MTNSVVNLYTRGTPEHKFVMCLCFLFKALKEGKHFAAGIEYANATQYHSHFPWRKHPGIRDNTIRDKNFSIYYNAGILLESILNMIKKDLLK
jgi:hypothetical protein